MELENESHLLERLKWAKYRLRILDEIEAKLEEMRAIAVHARDNDLDSQETDELNTKIRALEKEVNELDEKSKICWIDCQ
ncbi:hypothetical protein [Desulfosporosinus sp.]|uniref:hypothetical protein n=1 Tax=Desulfosporosinus sp. TaxID=157907 RepID=UPI0025C27D89|nr:hypothetical protein [Desulfosporosinus sp.]MBC2723564.1 hypothetical protein [Desulfosporosinus sp.]MBC2726155.1 hypothetical protein [Desulfosporosinus sp.]